MVSFHKKKCLLIQHQRRKKNHLYYIQLVYWARPFSHRVLHLAVTPWNAHSHSLIIWFSLGLYFLQGSQLGEDLQCGPEIWSQQNRWWDYINYSDCNWLYCDYTRYTPGREKLIKHLTTPLWLFSCTDPSCKNCTETDLCSGVTSAISCSVDYVVNCIGASSSIHTILKAEVDEAISTPVFCISPLLSQLRVMQSGTCSLSLHHALIQVNTLNTLCKQIY